MLEHAACHQPEIEVAIGFFGGGLEGREDNFRAPIGLAVEAHALALWHVGIIALAEAIERFLAIYDRPELDAGLVINIEVVQVVRFPAPEIGVFLEKPLLDVEAEVLAFLVVEALGHLTRGVFVDLAVGEEQVE